jgi:hypothetical protein
MVEAESGITLIREREEQRPTPIAIDDLLPRKLPGGPIEGSFAGTRGTHRFRSSRERTGDLTRPWASIMGAPKSRTRVTGMSARLHAAARPSRWLEADERSLTLH